MPNAWRVVRFFVLFWFVAQKGLILANARCPWSMKESFMMDYKGYGL